MKRSHIRNNLKFFPRGCSYCYHKCKAKSQSSCSRVPSLLGGQCSIQTALQCTDKNLGQKNNLSNSSTERRHMYIAAVLQFFFQQKTSKSETIRTLHFLYHPKQRIFEDKFNNLCKICVLTADERNESEHAEGIYPSHGLEGLIFLRGQLSPSKLIYNVSTIALQTLGL